MSLALVASSHHHHLITALLLPSLPFPPVSATGQLQEVQGRGHIQWLPHIHWWDWFQDPIDGEANSRYFVNSSLPSCTSSGWVSWTGTSYGSKDPTIQRTIVTCRLSTRSLGTSLSRASTLKLAMANLVPPTRSSARQPMQPHHQQENADPCKVKTLDD